MSAGQNVAAHTMLSNVVTYDAADHPKGVSPPPWKSRCGS